MVDIRDIVLLLIIKTSYNSMETAWSPQGGVFVFHEEMMSRSRRKFMSEAYQNGEIRDGATELSVFRPSDITKGN